MSSGELTEADGRALLARARLALRRHYGLAQAAGAGAGFQAGSPVMHGLRRAAFVSLHAEGGLRGCIGSLDPSLDLGELVDELAVAAASRDPRFPPLAPGEVERMRIEISVLTPPAPIRSPADIRIGRHGLVVERPPHRGVLLPQVAVEHGWDAAAFLSHTCLKAGLEKEDWRPWAAGRDNGLQVQVFSAQLLGESRR